MTARCEHPKTPKRDRICLAQHAVLLARAHDLWVHSHQVVVDSVLLLFLRFLVAGGVSG
jgi:hypothetical protein